MLPSVVQEVFQQALAYLGHNRLRVKLDTLNRKPAVTQSHNDAVCCSGADLEAVGQAITHYRQGVVANGGEGVGQTLKEPPAVVVDKRGLAVLDFTGAADPGPVAVADALVSQADAQDGEPAPELTDNLIGYAGLLRSTRSR